MNKGLTSDSSVARIRGLGSFSLFRSWGSASLHPRLYAFTRFAGFGQPFKGSIKGIIS